MKTIREQGWSWAGIAAAYAIGLLGSACKAPAPASSDSSSKFASGTHNAVALPIFVTGFKRRCGTGAPAQPCHGELIGLAGNWSGTVGGPPLSDDVAKKIEALNSSFKTGSTVLEDRLATDHRSALVLQLESIDDSYQVAANEITNPVVLARLTVDRDDSDGTAVDEVYGVDSKATYFFVIKPTNDLQVVNSWWGIIALTSSPRQANLVREGQGFGPCTMPDPADSQHRIYHQQKRYPFAWFMSCDVANTLSFEQIAEAKSARRLSAASKDTLIGKAPLEFREKLHRLLDGDDPIWITCGLGCCST